MTLFNRTTALALILGCSLLSASADAATLKSVGVAGDDYVRVGDLFDGVDAGADTVLGHAPAPGADMTINARTLLRIATLHNIDWSPKTGAEQIVVRREAHTLNSMDIGDAVKAALERKGVEGNYAVVLSNLNSAVTLPRNLPATAEVTDLNYTPGRDTFTATVAAPSAANPVKTISVAGTIEKTIQVPTLKATVSTGEIIGTTDIEWIDMSERVLLPDTIIDADKLIGKTPVRMVSLGQPIRLKDVTNPQLVARGDEITILYNLGGMQLSAKGKAMQNGAEGDTIRALNVASNRSMSARVTGDRTVTVQ